MLAASAEVHPNGRLGVLRPYECSLGELRRVFPMRHRRKVVLRSNMAAKHSRHIALTGPLAQYIEAQVAKGEYASVSEMVRTALRLLIERDQATACSIPTASRGAQADE